MTDENTRDDTASGRRTLSDWTPDRRSFLSNTAKAGGIGAMLALGGAGTAAADDHTGDGDGDEMEGPSDVDILNYALTLEKLEYEFYEEGLSMFDERDIANANSVARLDASIRWSVTDFIGVIRDHEKAHVDVLTSTIEDLGGTPVEPEFQFPLEDANEFIATAQVLENTGVAAYAGAAPLIQNADLIPPALSIHSVEARHAGMLNLANGEIPFPNAFDEALSMDEVLEAVEPFVVE
ncbi:hypothetical protein AUR64_06565 [Haloprofundus marisrubri]|uniref:Tat (Twin-arginine translocation) pathway signal sequence containing protein n=1 Tax=Haloprofundus marisrubri TaxID=1514971 RepID=A0A0W1REL7_9EURY|nr:ferritin-like domain-containing protein [Haloprofundus marisrubri]KTG11053.1 hypothetical protein AUR64_06565 [Haloprofundus marisrubri]